MNRNERRKRATVEDVAKRTAAVAGLVDARLAAHQTHTNDRIKATVTGYHAQVAVPARRQTRTRLMSVIRKLEARIAALEAR